MGFPTSPGVYSPQSPLSTPPRCIPVPVLPGNQTTTNPEYSPADEFSYMGAVDASTPYNSNSSPGRLSIPDPLADVHDAKQTKPNFEYDPATRKWVCTKCGGDFVTAHEARRHVKTAARCTGKKVECLRCGEHVHASRWSQKRHFATPLCRKKGRRRGAPTFTVDTAYKGVGEL